MTAHFINIGQGESVLLEFPCGAMLIDAGAQDAAARTRLIAYLNKFFARRTDRHKTLNTVLLTHNHIDHDFGLRTVAENFTVEQFVDNGMLSGPGAPNPKWLRNEVTSGHRHVQLKEILDTDVEAVTILQASISRKRSQPRSVMAAESSKHFHSATVTKAVYATGWDGTVRVVVKGKNDITVYREH